MAISALSAVLEQKVWAWTGSQLFPNLYIFVIGHPGTGKTRTIRVARNLIGDLPEFHLSPISMTFASLIDALSIAKRHIIRLPDDPLEYNTMYICADELGAFMHKFDSEMTKGLSALYDPDPYTHTRRTGDLKIKIKSPQINLLCGTTPQDLMDLMPESAWGQGFSSRIIMVFSDERIIGDDFATRPTSLTKDLEHDLAIINGLVGRFEVTKAYQEAVYNWRQMGQPPVPSHPKLLHYITRRHTHLYKLSMISAIDRGNSLILMKEDFDRSYNWLVNAETQMPEIFKAGATNADGQAMDEIHHFVMIGDKGEGVSEQRIIHFARERVPIHSILRIIEIMEKSGQIRCTRTERRSGIRFFSAINARQGPAPES